jgi:hypothetical protein
MCGRTHTQKRSASSDIIFIPENFSVFGERAPAREIQNKKNVF